MKFIYARFQVEDGDEGEAEREILDVGCVSSVKIVRHVDAESRFDDIVVTLTRAEAELLFDEVAMADSHVSYSGQVPRYVRQMIRMCRAVRQQLAVQGVTGVLAASEAN
jgi:hypothetical protein